MTDEVDEPVGYKRPPRHSRFRKGQSGNPRGRRKGSGMRSAAVRVLDRKVVATIDGQRQKVPITEALVLQLAQKALAGDVRATREFLKIADQVATVAPEADQRNPLVIIRRFVAPKDCNPALRFRASLRRPSKNVGLPKPMAQLSDGALVWNRSVFWAGLAGVIMRLGV